jgi:hypothetical protein
MSYLRRATSRKKLRTASESFLDSRLLTNHLSNHNINVLGRPSSTKLIMEVPLTVQAPRPAWEAPLMAPSDNLGTLTKTD